MGILLHSFAQKFEARQADLDVLWPCPGAFFDLTIKELQGHLIGCLFRDIEDEHSSEHLVENDTDCPHIYLVTVARSFAPVGLDLLCRHH